MTPPPPGLQLEVKVASDTQAELLTGDDRSPPILLRQRDGYAREPGRRASRLTPDASMAECTTGYSPFLQFDVPDLSNTILTVLEHGGACSPPRTAALR